MEAAPAAPVAPDARGDLNAGEPAPPRPLRASPGGKAPHSCFLLPLTGFGFVRVVAGASRGAPGVSLLR